MLVVSLSASWVKNSPVVLSNLPFTSPLPTATASNFVACCSVIMSCAAASAIRMRLYEIMSEASDWISSRFFFDFFASRYRTAPGRMKDTEKMAMGIPLFD